MMQMVKMAAHVVHNVRGLSCSLVEMAGRKVWEEMNDEERSVAVDEVISAMGKMLEEEADGEDRLVCSVISGMMAPKEEGND